MRGWAEKPGNRGLCRAVPCQGLPVQHPLRSTLHSTMTRVALGTRGTPVTHVRPCEYGMCY